MLYLIWWSRKYSRKIMATILSFFKWLLHFIFSAPIRAVYDFIHSPFFYCLFLTSSRFYITTQCISLKIHVKIKCLHIHTIPALYISEKIGVENYIFFILFLWWLFGVGKNALSTLKHILAFVISDWVELEISIFIYKAYVLTFSHFKRNWNTVNITWLLHKTQFSSLLHFDHSCWQINSFFCLSRKFRRMDDYLI